MTTAGQVLDIARSHLGYKEGPNNDTPFGDRMGAPNAAWCGSFVACCLIDAGMRVTTTGNNGTEPSPVSTWNGWLQYRRLGRAVQDPQPGDLAFINPGPKGHVCLVESFDGTFITSIDGNTTPPAGIDSYNGGGVYRKRRLRSTYVGFGRPLYAAIPQPPTPLPPPAPPAVVPQLPPPVATTATPEAHMLLVVDNVGFFALGPNDVIVGLTITEYAQTVENSRGVPILRMPQGPGQLFLESSLKRMAKALA